MPNGKTRRVRRFRFVAAVALVVGAVLLAEAAVILGYGEWPPVLPPQLDVIGAFLALFGARAKTFGGGVAAALMGVFLVCAGALELRGPRA